jgi:hypothetical protein
MKYFLYIFTYLLLGASCSSPSRPIDYGTELTATDSICLSIDEHTHYVFTTDYYSIFYR